MTRAVPCLLAVLALVLSGTLAWELDASDPPQEAVRSPSPLAAGPGAAIATAPDRAAEVQTVLGRPLFDPRRRPASQPNAPATPPPSPASVPRVSGVLVSAAGRSAIFSLPGNEKALVAHEGGQVGGFTVQSISSGQVTLLGPDGTTVLRPTLRKGLPAQAPVAVLPLGLPNTTPD